VAQDATMVTPQTTDTSMITVAHLGL